jgi:hypothetical protein
MEIRTTKYALGELAEKCRTVADEPDLQDDYGVTAEWATDAVMELMRMEREGVVLDTSKFPSPVLKMLAGECSDAAAVQRDVAKDARRNLSNQYGQIQKGARELEALAGELKKVAA